MAETVCNWECPLCGRGCTKNHKPNEPHFCSYHSATPFSKWQEKEAIVTEELALKLKLRDKDEETKEFYWSLFFNRPVKGDEK